MTDKTTHKPGCEALGGYGHGVGPCSCSEARSERLELADRLISNAEIDECEGCNPVVVGLERSAATELRRQHAEIQQLKAQLSARQAAPEETIRDALVRARDWFESQAKVVSKGCGSPWNLMQLRDERDAADAALSAAPPPTDREQLAVDGRYTITIECGAAQARFVITEMQIESAPSPAEYVGHAVSKAIAAIDKRRISHGIGATNG